jgi:vacuolar iron transporter family protein
MVALRSALARRSGGRHRRRLAQEQRAAAVYRALAAKRTGEDREILLALARAEERHAAHWAAKLHPSQRPASKPGGRSRLLGWLARRLGSLIVLGLVQPAEAGGHYEDDAEATAGMAADERVHALVVAGLAQQQRARASGWFRAAVFGANDGLVSNFSLVAGMAGAGSSSQVILLAGLAGLLAGALSMAAGEYISVRSQRELLEAAASELDPATLAALREHEESELALVFRARGSSPEQPSSGPRRCSARTPPRRRRPRWSPARMWSGRPGRPRAPASWPLPPAPSSRSCRSSSPPVAPPS